MSPNRIINTLAFQKSLKDDLIVAKDKVRNLIGDAHWGEDGRHKEEVLKDILRRNLPKNLSVGTGFILKNIGGLEAEVSPQIDIIIYENMYPTLFNEGDFIITTQDHVRGIIEVKTKVRNSNIKKFCEEFDERCEFIDSNGFKGLFSYEYDGEINNDNVVDVLKKSSGRINHISLGKDYLIKHRNNIEGEEGHSLAEEIGPYYNIYQLNDLSFSYFIGNLMCYVIEHDLETRRRFLFPLDEGKEAYCIKSVHYDTD